MLKIVRGVAGHVERRGVPREAQHRLGGVHADGVLRMDVQIGEKRAWRGSVAGHRQPGDGMGLGHDQLVFALVGQPQLHPSPGPVASAPHERQGEVDRAGDPHLQLLRRRQLGRSEISPGILDAIDDLKRRVRPHEARREQAGARRQVGKYSQRQPARHRSETGRAHGVDKDPEMKRVLDKGLRARARPAMPAVAEPEHDPVPGLQVAVNHVDDHRLLVGALVPLLVEADLELAHRGGALARENRPRLILRRKIVGASGIARLKQGPVGVELEDELQPSAVGEARGAHLVGDDEFEPFAGAHLVT